MRRTATRKHGPRHMDMQGCSWLLRACEALVSQVGDGRKSETKNELYIHFQCILGNSRRTFRVPCDSPVIFPWTCFTWGHAASGDLENPGSRKLPCCVPSRARLGALAQRPNDMWDHNSYAGASPTRYLDCTYVIGALSPREQSTLGPSPFQLQSSHPHGEWNQVMAEHVECMAVMQPSTRLLYASSARTAVRSASRLEAMRLRFGVLCWRALVMYFMSV